MFSSNKRYLKNYKKSSKKKSTNDNTSSRKFQIVIAVINTLFLISIAFFSLQTWKFNEKLMNLQNVMSNIQYSSTIAPQLFVKDVHISLKSDSLRVKHNLINASLNSALNISGTYRLISCDSNFIINDPFVGSTDIHQSMYRNQILEFPFEIVDIANPEDNCIQNFHEYAIYLHFYYDYYDVLGYPHKSYFVYRIEYSFKDSRHLFTNSEIRSLVE